MYSRLSSGLSDIIVYSPCGKGGGYYRTHCRDSGVSRGVGGQADERQGSTEAQDLYGTLIRLTRDGLTVGEKFVPFAEMGGRQPESDVSWNPGTRLFEVLVFRRNGPDLIIGNLPLHTAEQLREAIIEALRERYT
jgi:hypothetical protein